MGENCNPAECAPNIRSTTRTLAGPTFHLEILRFTELRDVGFTGPVIADFRRAAGAHPPSVDVPACRHRAVSCRPVHVAGGAVSPLVSRAGHLLVAIKSRCLHQGIANNGSSTLKRRLLHGSWLSVEQRR